MSSSSFCSICRNEDASVCRVNTRAKKNNWLQCDGCKNWLHAECGGFTVTEFRKFAKGYWFKCVVCCLQQIRKSSQGSTDISGLVTLAVDNRVSATSTTKDISSASRIIEVRDDLASEHNIVCSQVSQQVCEDYFFESRHIPVASQVGTAQEIDKEQLSISSDTAFADNILIVDKKNKQKW